MNLSIVIPTLNEEAYLPKLLSDLQLQTLKDFEIIVSDGNSKDQTQTIARKYKCKLITSSRRSPAIQRNAALQHCRGVYILFLDADVRLYSPDILEKAIKQFDDRKLDVAAFYLTFGSGSFGAVLSTVLHQLFSFLCQYIHPLSAGSSTLIKKDLFAQIGGYDANYYIGEDHIMATRAAKKGKFRMLTVSPIFTSPRRFETDGYLKIWIIWLKATIHHILYGSVTQKDISYEYNNSNKYKSP